MELSGDRKEEISDRVPERASIIEERLEHIPHGRVMPDLKELSFHEARRFNLATVFVDINDSGRYLTRNGAKDTLFMLNLFIPEMMKLVEENSGYFEKNTGDGILAYFGAGDPHEVAVDKILRYLADIKYALANHINPTLEEFEKEPISISAGAAYAEDVYISRIGVYNESRRVAISTAANAAFLLEQEADNNQYLVDEGVYRHAEKEQGLGKYFEWGGILENYERGSEETGYKPAEFYKFQGHWESTSINNL